MNEVSVPLIDRLIVQLANQIPRNSLSLFEYPNREKKRVIVEVGSGKILDWVVE